MRRSIPLRAAALSTMLICGATAIVWSRPKVHAAIPPVATVAAAVTQFGGAAPAQEEGDEEEAPRIYVRLPYGPDALATYQKLQQKIDMPFSQETPLGEVLKYVVDQLTPIDKDGKPLSDDPPLQFYVDPNGLQEVEKTIDSPIVLDLKKIPTSTALELSLKQLNLEYSVHPDGIVVIDAEGSNGSNQQEPMLLILNELRQLRSEVAHLRSRPGGAGGMAGGPGGIGGMMGGSGGGGVR